MSDVIEELTGFARSLLGAHVGRDRVRIRITEVEAYAGPLDPASHAFNRTPRSEPMYGPHGHAYCYFTYGMHWCLNVVWGPPGTAGGVLLRAGEVVAGHDIARQRRGSGIGDRRLARGPACLAACLAVGRDEIGQDLFGGNDLRLIPRTDSEPPIQSGPRVGIKHAADHPWRFWVAGDPTVSAYRRHPKAQASASG